ncbi:MAG: F0F1 ATP synthase subunit B [Thermosulfidibacteraceae bacterium]
MRLFKLLYAVIFLLAFSQILLASSGHEGGGHHVDIKMEIFRIVNFLIFVFLIYKFAGKSIKKLFSDRVENIRRGLEEAERAYEEALRKYNEAKGIVGRLGDEVKAINENARREAEEQVKRIKEETERMVERLREQAKSACDLEIKRAKRELEKEAADLAISIAKDILVKNVTSEDHRRLLEEYMNKVREVH